MKYSSSCNLLLQGVSKLKTIRVSDEVHQKLTRILGERMAKTAKAQTFNDVIEDLISQKAAENKT